MNETTESEWYKFNYVRLGYAFNNTQEQKQGFVLDWSSDGIGFGQLTFVLKADEMTCETEGMSQEFVKQAVEFWLQSDIKYVDK